MALLFLVTLAVLHAASAQDGLLGVGGFISPSSQLAEARSAAKLPRPNLSSVTVELQTTNGVKLHESDCSPNGYYFIPVNEPGTYILRVTTPSGWSFEPSQVTVICGKNDCAENQDVNFAFTGFNVQGSIHGAGSAGSCGLKNEAPSGVKVTITSDGDPSVSQAVQSTVGQFTFTNLFPGSYKLTANHPDFDVAPKLLPVQLEFDGLILSQTFGITGYKLVGLVTSASGAVPGVQVLLYSAEPLELSCNDAKQTGPELSGKHLLCSAITDDRGRYEFNGVHCAKYTLLPLHTDKDAEFEIQPAFQDVVVQQGHLHVEKAFRVTGFAASGRVVTAMGTGIAGVQVRLNAKPVATTDSSGWYKISSLQAGTYTITAQGQHFDFSPLESVSITPGMKKLPDIQAERIAVEGSVSLTDSSFAGRPRLLTLSSDDGSFNKKVTTVDGKFSVKLPAGRYRVAPVVLPEEKVRGLVLSPAYRDVVVLGDVPVTDLHFTQSRFTIHGAVKCVGGGCDGKLRLHVVADKYDEQMLLEEVAQGAAAADGTVHYKLDEMVPLGTYSISIVEPTYCWEQPKVQVLLSTEDVTAPTLVQKGFNALVSTTHVGTLTATSASSQATYELVNGPPQQVCLPGIGVFSLSMNSSCFFFGKEPFVFDTANSAPDPVKFTAGQALVHGELVAQGTQVSEVSLELTNTATGAQVVTPATADPQNPGLFRYQFFADLEAEIQLQPKVVGALPYPKKQVVRVLPDTCTPSVSPFALRSGLFIEGAIEPAVQGVMVSMSYKGRSSAGEVGAAGEVLGQFQADDAGVFRVGPLYDDVGYDVQVDKTGYRFKNVTHPPIGDKYIFAAEKLASVIVQIDLASAQDAGMVLLSFSGDNSFRQNAKLGKDGTYTFYDMLPGTYYLRPQLKEYQFEPAVAEVVVQEGGEHVIKFGSKRTAYSVMGTTRTVNGQVVGGVVVEARSGGVVRESSISTDEGKYRIQGLIPGQQYTLTVRPTNTILKAFPDQHPVAMEAADVLNVDFSTFPSAPQLVISGVVEVPDEALAGTWVQVLHAGTRQRVASTPLDASRYYQVKVSEPGRYVLRLVTSLSDSTYDASETKVEVETIPVQAEPLVLTMHPRVTHEQESLSSSLSMPVTVAALLVGLAVWQRSFLAEVFQVGPALSKPGESNDAEWLTNSSIGKRRNNSGNLGGAAASATAAPLSNLGSATSTNGGSGVPQKRASRIS